MGIWPKVSLKVAKRCRVTRNRFVGLLSREKINLNAMLLNSVIFKWNATNLGRF